MEEHVERIADRRDDVVERLDLRADVVVKNFKVLEGAKIEEVVLGESKAVDRLVPDRIGLDRHVEADADGVARELEELELARAFDDRKDFRALVLELVDEIHVLVRLRAVAEDADVGIERFLFEHLLDEIQVVVRRSLKMCAFAHEGHDDFLILVDLHWVMIEELAFVAHFFREGGSRVEQVLEALLDDERHEYLERRSHLFRKVADVVYVVTLLDDQVAVFVEIKILGVVLFGADLPKLFRGVVVHFSGKASPPLLFF